jgi:hypothetical protein
VAALFLFILPVSHLWVFIVPLALLVVAGIMLFALARRHRVPNQPYPNQSQGYPNNPNYPPNPNQPYTQNGPYNPNNGYPY